MPLYFAAVETFFLLFFLAYSQRSEIGCPPHKCHDVPLVWICNACLKCAAHGSLKIQDTKITQKNCHLRPIALLCQALSLQLRHVSTFGKKLVKQQYLLHMSSQYGERRPTNGWDRLVSLAHPSKFQWVSGAGFITAPTSLTGGQLNFARCLAVSWAGTLHNFWGLLPLNGILPGAEFTFCPSLAFCISSITAWHSSSGRQPNFVAWYKE